MITKHPTLSGKTPRPPARLDRELAAIRRVVSEHHGLSPDALTSRDRHEPLAEIRLIAMFLSRSLTRATFLTIAMSFDRSDHNTVRHACDVVPFRMGREPSLFSMVEKLRKDSQLAIAALK